MRTADANQPPLGTLVGKLEGTTFTKLGSNGHITAEHTGRLYLLLYGTMADKAGCSGSVTVLIEAE